MPSLIVRFTTLQRHQVSTRATFKVLTTGNRPGNPLRYLSSMSNHDANAEDSKQSSNSNDPSTLSRSALPEPTPNSSTAAQSGETVAFNQTVKLDHLGPIVINTDGTMNRISNWNQMSEIERTNTLRILTKRNAQRLAALRDQKTAQ